MRSHAHAAALAACLFATSALADTMQTVPPEKVGLSAERLGKLTAIFKTDVEKGLLPGAVIAVSRKGQVAYYETIGYRDPVSKAPMPPDALFSIASMTKPMVSLAVMMLHDEGKLQLGDPIGKYIPALKDRRVGVVRVEGTKNVVDTVPANRQPTIQDLLRHTSGFTYGGRGETEIHKLWPASSSTSAITYTKEEFIAQLAKAPLLYQPGTQWDYSLSVDVQGLIVEQITGKPLAEVLNERIWQPLGMVDTGFSVPDAKKSRYALAYANDPLTGQPMSVLHANGKALKFDCGGGCGVSTTPDYLRFAQMLANGGVWDGKRLIARKTLEMMTSDQLGPEVRARTTSPVLQEGYGFGLGFAVRTQTGMAQTNGSTGDYNWGGAYGTYFWVDPKEQLAVVLMTANVGESRAYYRNVTRNLVLQSIID